MYISATRLVNLGLRKAFFQLLRMQMHTPYVRARYDILFQIRFCKFSVLPHSQTTCSKVKACNLKDCKPDVESQQSMWFNVVIGNNRKFEKYKSLLYKFHSNIITMGFPNVNKVAGEILSSLIMMKSF